MRLQHDGVSLFHLYFSCRPFTSLESRIPLRASGSDLGKELLRITSTFSIVHRGQVVLRSLVLRWIQQIVITTYGHTEREITKALGALAVGVGHPQGVIVQRVADGVYQRFIGLNQNLPFLAFLLCHMLT